MDHLPELQSSLINEGVEACKWWWDSPHLGADIKFGSLCLREISGDALQN